jgi:hypothetical protein
MGCNNSTIKGISKKNSSDSVSYSSDSANSDSSKSLNEGENQKHYN